MRGTGGVRISGGGDGGELLGVQCRCSGAEAHGEQLSSIQSLHSDQHGQPGQPSESAASCQDPVPSLLQSDQDESDRAAKAGLSCPLSSSILYQPSWLFLLFLSK